ncbi:MAG: hypothetical protein RLZZ436_4066 [Planctomycetota bacterium]|jgi:hypothetical protein
MSQVQGFENGLTVTCGCRPHHAGLRCGILFAIGLLAMPFVAGCGGITQADHERATAEIANDLLGEFVWTGEMTWRFAGPEEFERMRIVSVNSEENSTRFIVDMDLIDMNTREKFAMRASVNYLHFGSKDNWSLGSVSCIRMSRRY